MSFRYWDDTPDHTTDNFGNSSSSQRRYISDGPVSPAFDPQHRAPFVSPTSPTVQAFPSSRRDIELHAVGSVPAPSGGPFGDSPSTENLVLSANGTYVIDSMESTGVEKQVSRAAKPGVSQSTRKWTQRKIILFLLLTLLLVLAAALIPLGFLVLKPKTKSVASSTTNTGNNSSEPATDGPASDEPGPGSFRKVEPGEAEQEVARRGPQDRGQERGPGHRLGNVRQRRQQHAVN